MLSVMLGGSIFVGHLANHNDLAPNYAGILMGITNTPGTISAFLLPAIVGALTEAGVRDNIIIIEENIESFFFFFNNRRTRKMILSMETRNEIYILLLNSLFDRETMRVYDWEIFNYGNYGNLDEWDSYPVVTNIPRFRESYSPSSGRIFSNTIGQNGNVYELLIEYLRKLVSRCEFGLIEIFWRSQYSYVKRYFREFNLSLRSIRNFQIFPTFPIKFISRMRSLTSYLELSRNIIHFPLRAIWTSIYW